MTPFPPLHSRFLFLSFSFLVFSLRVAALSSSRVPFPFPPPLLSLRSFSRAPFPFHEPAELELTDKLTSIDGVQTSPDFSRFSLLPLFSVLWQSRRKKHSMSSR